MHFTDCAASRLTPSAFRPAQHSSRRHFRRAICGLVALASWLTGAATPPKPLPLAVPLVITQVPATKAPAAATPAAQNLQRNEGYEGGRLIVVSPDGSVRVLSEGFVSACDPAVSFDGQHILFAGRQAAGAPWRIWEIGADGSGLRAVTPENLAARSPLYVSTLFTLNSPEPWRTLVFVGRTSGTTESGRNTTASLYNIKLDGTELRRLTFNPNQNLDPAQTWDGRLLYSAEVYGPDRAGPGRLGLRAIHIEGADMEAYGGERGARLQQMPCPTAGGLVVYVESDAPAPDGSGQLACVEQRRPHVTHRVLTKGTAHRYLHPAALQQNQVLVARHAAKDKGTWGIVRFDADTGASDPIFDTKEYDEVQAVALQARPAPDGHSTVVTTTDATGTFYGLDCYTADATRSGRLQPGEIKRVRFIAGDFPADGPVRPRQLIGEAPVESDGSFNVVVPADTPLLVQTLDERGLALGTCGWIWVKPKEVRGCIGCHEDPERVPENNFVLALHRPSTELTPATAQRRVPTFARDIAPILERHCATADCHGGTQARPALAFGTPAQQAQAFATLTTGKHPFIDAGRARTSPLVWYVVGADTRRPWDAAQPASQPKLHPAGGTPLTADEITTLIQWIDLGAAAGLSPAP